MDKLLNKKHSVHYLTLKDYSVSGEQFDLLYNNEYEMLITFPQPKEGELPSFYKSDKYISHTDAKETVFDKAYHKVKSFMLSKKVDWIEGIKLEKGNLLDLGAGTGDFLLEAKKRGWKVTGVEPNSKAIQVAQKKGIELLDNSNELPNNHFDVITMWHVLEHVPDLKKQINELNRLLKKDGLLIIAVPNYKSYDAYHYKNFWAAYDVPRHLWHFSKNSIHKIFEEEDFNVRKTLPLKFDSYYVSLLSEKYKEGRKNILSALKTAFLSNLKAKKTCNWSSLVYFIHKNH